MIRPLFPGFLSQKTRKYLGTKTQNPKLITQNCGYAALDHLPGRDTEKLINDQRVRRFQTFERQARKRLMVLHAAPSIEALMLNPGNKFHALSGNRKGQYAISNNKQWRVCFEWNDGNAYHAEITDYH